MFDDNHPQAFGGVETRRPVSVGRHSSLKSSTDLEPICMAPQSIVTVAAPPTSMHPVCQKVPMPDSDRLATIRFPRCTLGVVPQRRGAIGALGLDGLPVARPRVERAGLTRRFSPFPRRKRKTIARYHFSVSRNNGRS